MVFKLPRIVQESLKLYEEIKQNDTNVEFVLTQQHSYDGANQKDFENILASGDNLHFMKYLLDQRKMGGKLNLIYTDPPFFSKSNYEVEIKLESGKINKIPIMKQKAYQDTWEKGMEEYLQMLTLRFLFMRDLLAEDGSLWVHLDWHAVHYVKLILDHIFGEKNFINEIIWQYKSGGAGKRSFARKHDTLLFYAKSPSYYFMPMKEKSYNRGFKPYRFKGVEEFQDEVGWYTMVTQKDVWQLDMVGRTSSERTGYATQKPEALLGRILESCTKPGDICADFFGGSGTLSAVADKMERKWISCDMGRPSLVKSQQRLSKNKANYGLYVAKEEFIDKGQNSTIQADAVVDNTSISGKNVLKISLRSYKLKSIDHIAVEEKHVAILRSILEEDSLQFLACWGLDCCYDGRVFRPKVYHCRNKDGIITEDEIRAAKIGTLAIGTLDIFGNDAIVIIELFKWLLV